MTAGRAPSVPVAPAGCQPDPRGVRVSVVGADAAGPEPIVLEPAAQPAMPSLQQLDAERAILREGPEGRAHRVLLLSVAGSPTAMPAGVVRREVVIDGWRLEVDVESATRAALRERARRGRVEAGHSGPTEVHAIIPGVVVSVSVAPGDAVAAGQQLLVVEAMKMQNELRAPREGTIERVAVGAGATIDVGDLLLVIA